MRKQVLLITTTNLSCNPRLAKELLSLKSRYDVSFLGFHLGNWSDEFDQDFISKHDLEKTNYISAVKRPLLDWLISTIIQKVSKYIYPFTSKVLYINAFGSDKRSWLLLKFLRKKRLNPDLIIAHNLGALYPAWKFAQRYNIPFAFDVEDYHPGEVINIDTNNEKKRRELLLMELLPFAQYVSYASPLIGKNTFNLVGEKNVKNKFLIRNCFNENEFQRPINTTGKLKFVWFSQNIDKGRGLEILLEALVSYSDQIELTLIGSVRSNEFREFLLSYSFVRVCNPMKQSELHKELAAFDVGLAIELSTADFNREICLTNKILAYAQSGLYILATDTLAQQEFMLENIELGIITGQTIEQFRESISILIIKLESIRAAKNSRFEKSKKIAFENEYKKLEDFLSTANHIGQATRK